MSLDPIHLAVILTDPKGRLVRHLDPIKRTFDQLVDLGLFDRAGDWPPFHWRPLGRVAHVLATEISPKRGFYRSPCLIAWDLHYHRGKLFKAPGSLEAFQAQTASYEPRHPRSMKLNDSVVVAGLPYLPGVVNTLLELETLRIAERDPDYRHGEAWRLRTR